MAFSRVPFDPTASVATLPAGLTVGDQFCDSRGRVFRLMRLNTALTATNPVANSLMVKAASNVVTDVIASGIDATYPVPAGICLTSSAVVSDYVLLGIKGRFTSVVSTGTINAGDAVYAAATTKAVGGNAESTAVTYRLLKGNVGVALAAAAANIVDLDINIC